MSPGRFTRSHPPPGSVVSGALSPPRRPPPPPPPPPPHAAGGRAHRPDQDSMATGDEHVWAPCLQLIASRANRPQARAKEYVEGFLESAGAEVQHVVVGERAGVEPGRGQAGDVARVHPVQHGFRGLEVVTASDAGLEVDDAEIWRQVVEDLHRIAPRPREAHRLGDGPGGCFGQRDVGIGAGGVLLPQPWVSGHRQNLIHTLFPVDSSGCAATRRDGPRSSAGSGVGAAPRRGAGSAHGGHHPSPAACPRRVA